LWLQTVPMSRRCFQNFNVVLDSTNPAAVPTVVQQIKLKNEINVDDEVTNPAAVPTAAEPLILIYPFLGGMDIERHK
jgi:hypothetical protein